MSIPTAAQTAFIRAYFESRLTDVCTISQPVRVTTGAGTTTTYSAVYTNEPCRIAPFPGRTPEEREIASQHLGRALAWLTVKHDRVIGKDYQVTRGGKVYEVLPYISRGPIAWTLRIPLALIE